MIIVEGIVGKSVVGIPNSDIMLTCSSKKSMARTYEGSKWVHKLLEIRATYIIWQEGAPQHCRGLFLSCYTCVLHNRLLLPNRGLCLYFTVLQWLGWRGWFFSCYGSTVIVGCDEWNTLWRNWSISCSSSLSWLLLVSSVGMGWSVCSFDISRRQEWRR